MTGQVAIVTGGAGGLGRAICRRLTGDGYVVVSADTTEAIGAEAAREHCCDITDERSVAELITDACEHGELGAVVNCAGRFSDAPLAGVTVDDWDAIFAVNVRGPMLMAREAAAVWKRQGTGGRLVNIASRTWLSGGPPAYTASKAALIGLTRALARELGPDGVTVNAVAPGFVPTPMTTDGSVQEAQERAARFVAITPLKRVCEPAEVADVVGFLASSAARFITGEVLSVAGGAQLAAGF